MGTNKIELEVTAGEGLGERHELSGIVVIGRGPACTLRLKDPAVSREHAVLCEEEGVGWVLEDLDSRSGSFVNRVRTRKAVLLDGDSIRLGTVEFRLRVRSSRPALGEVAPSDVRVVTTRHMPTARLSLDVVKFRTSARFLEDAGLGDLSELPEAEQPAQNPTPGTEPGQGGLTHLTHLTHLPGQGLGSGSEPRTATERRLELLIQISTSLAAIHQPQRLARETAVRLVGMFPQARRVGFFSLEEDPKGGEDVLRPTYLLDQSGQGGQIQISQSVLQQSIEARCAIVSEDVRSDPRFSVSESLTEAGVVSILCAPFCLGQRVLGALYLDTADLSAPFDEAALRIVSGVAALLASSFENARLFARAQAESVRRASLERYFSPDLVERVLRGDLPLAREGRKAEGTILFVDIRGFTHLTIVTDPEVLVATLNAYFASMQRIVFRTRGTVERFGGDSILSYWGIIDQDPDAPAHALRAAIAMQIEVFRLNPELTSAGRPPIQIAVGLNTGEVIAGDVGSSERYEFTILGDAINMARRFEALAKAWEIIAGSATIAAAGEDVLHRPLPPTTVKGKEDAVQVSLVYGLRQERPRGTAYWELAVPAQLLLEGAKTPLDTLVAGLEVRSAGRVALQILTAEDPDPGHRAAIRLTLPRATESVRVDGQVLPADVEETLMIAGLNLSVSGSGVQRIWILLDRGADALDYLGAVP